MAENIYSYRYGDGNNQEDNEYPQGTLFLSLKPDEKLSDDEIKVLFSPAEGPKSPKREIKVLFSPAEGPKSPKREKKVSMF